MGRNPELAPSDGYELVAFEPDGSVLVKHDGETRIVKTPWSRHASEPAKNLTVAEAWGQGVQYLRIVENIALGIVENPDTGERRLLRYPKDYSLMARWEDGEPFPEGARVGLILPGAGEAK